MQLVTRGAPAMRQDFELHHGDGETETTGVGLYVAGTPKGMIILGIVPGSPGERAGLKNGDRFLRIDGVPVEGLTVSDCTQRLRGTEGSKVSVAVAREDGTESEVTLVRELLVR